ncbi:molybdopterin molybdotransferase MoeA [Sinomonas sp. ASV322]|uniref:molybdopterin molybdotransferase MoeA n=1 Tax=Sinomonas sp. ASV322 TaxID=3041920 RepID=UPI0027DD0092|nr:molybdopterin molybdotransferase MoeA [Sinomonas sp. ASV322]MDQ4503173.1 molybdopterin molybdotransferase MoeA [Sinomonas sp. ASV322]
MTGGAPSAPHPLHHSWSEARAAAAAAGSRIPPVRVPLARCAGRVLAEDVLAISPMPHYSSSAMDGWAVSGTGPWILVEAGEPLSAHQASPIVTGGALPGGTRAVLRREHGEIGPDDDGLPHLRLSPAAPPGAPSGGADIRPGGEEAQPGDLLLPAGTELGPAQLALAAIAGLDDLPVEGRPLVRLVRTGSEVVESGVPEPGRVRDVFSFLIPPLIEGFGGVVVDERKIGDDAEEWRAALADDGGTATGEPDEPGAGPGGAPADVVITTGGTGKGESDHLREIVAELGGRLVVDGVSMRPGHPTVLAELPDGRFFVGLPGNPLAAVMGFLAVAEPLLAAMSGRAPLAAVELPSGAAFEPELKRTRLVPFRRMYGMASPAGASGSGMLRGLARADGVMVIPPHGVELGEPVEAFALPWGRPLVEPAAAKTGAKPKRRAVGSKEPVDWSGLDA